jgi:serine/threonine protein kinase/tetratricopeptide (TPR) repeat protein
MGESSARGAGAPIGLQSSSDTSASAAHTTVGSGADGGIAENDTAQDLPAGSVVGSYTIQSVIGRGGMGVVYLAEQVSPRRTVALKLIRPGVAGAQTLGRFEYEVQILGRLQHPGIAQIYEAGTTRVSGSVQPFFAMEHVDGRPLNAFIADARAGIRERLALFVKICDAVQHAHAKGVIHRDLKPGNILVALGDERGIEGFRDSGTKGKARANVSIPQSLNPSIPPSAQPKVLDFGVARSTDQDMRGQTLQTTVGQLIGTVPYMSPEQIAGDPRELDTRSDVYSLGVILYEILAGRLPYELSHKPLAEAARIICEAEPEPLGTANRALRGDLEIITVHALQKDRTKRYQSAGDLAADVRRFLHHEPIVARPPSAWYQFTRFTRRNPALAAAGGTLALALVAGLLVVSGLLARAMAAETLATQRAADAELARGTAADKQEIAERESGKARAAADEAEAVNNFLNDMLASVNPSQGDREMTVAQVLEKASGEIGNRFPRQPLVEAAVRTTIGRSWRGLGHSERAEPQFRAALVLREKAGPDAIAAKLQTMNDLASALQDQSKLDEAEALFRAALPEYEKTMGVDAQETLVVRNNLGLLLLARSRFAEAEEHLRAALEGQRRVSGNEVLETLNAMTNLSTVLQQQGKLDPAEALARESLETRRRVFGPRHPGTLVAVNNLGTLLAARGKLEEAEPYYVESMRLSREVLGEEHPDTLTSIANVAGLARDRGKPEEAEARFREVLALQRKVLGEKHPDTIDTLRNLGMTLRDAKRFEEAEEYLREAVRKARDALGDESLDTLAAEYGLGLLLLKTERAAEAEQILRGVSERSRRALGEDGAKTGQFRTAFGSALTSVGKYEEAETELLAAHGALAKRLGEKHVLTDAARLALVRLYEACNRPGDAEKWRGRPE